MCDELCRQDLESLPLPKDWTANVRHAVLNVIGIVRIAMLAGCPSPASLYDPFAWIDLAMLPTDWVI